MPPDDPRKGPGGAAAAPAEPQPAAAAAAVLARGHLHPAILLLRLLDALRQAALPALLGLAVEPWFLVLAIVLFLLQLGTSIARYLTLDYTLTREELRVREGILERQERRIPLDRIQDIGFESTILRRALGLAVVLVETASGTGIEARLDALSKADAEHLREVLLAARPATAAPPATPTGDATAAATAPPAATEWLVHRSTASELMLRGLTDLRLSAFLVTGYAAFEFADRLGVAGGMMGVVRNTRDWLLHLPPAAFVGLLAAVLFGVMAIGVATATFGNLIQFHGFALVLRGDALLRRYGLLTTRQKALPRARVQRATIEQTWLRRLLGLAVVKADSAGGRRSDGQDTPGGWDVVVPLIAVDRAHALLPAILPGLERQPLVWRRGSRRLVLRTALQGVVIAALLTPYAVHRTGPAGLLLLLAVPLWAVLGALVWRNLGWARGDEFFALQHGIIGRNYACLPTAKIQAVVIRQGPIAQLLGLADLTVYVAGGSPTRLPDLTIGDARQLAEALAERAARAAAADW